MFFENLLQFVEEKIGVEVVRIGQPTEQRLIAWCRRRVAFGLGQTADDSLHRTYFGLA